MTRRPVIESWRNRCFVGDVRDGLKRMAASRTRAQCVITSPPYFGLRDYNTAQWQGGDPKHEHVGMVERQNPPGTKKQASNKGSNAIRSGDCACGAKRIDNQIGLEDSVEAYVQTMVEVFRLVRDVLADDGTLWLNLGDSYAVNASAGNKVFGNPAFNENRPSRVATQTPARSIGELKPKDLCGIPWRVAFALQADGWYLRSDIIWAKPNPMPESVTDRPTKNHEYVFLLTKQPHYFYDHVAIAEPMQTLPHAPGNKARKTGGGQDFDDGSAQRVWGSTRRGPAWAERKAAGATRGNVGFDGMGGGGTQRAVHGKLSRNLSVGDFRNKRTVWTLPPGSYDGAHFATFSPALVETCLLAGTSAAGHCPKCGAGWRRSEGRPANAPPAAANGRWSGFLTVQRRSGAVTTTAGWEPGCECGLKPVPAIVLDPFLGSGTVAQVAHAFGRDWTGCELNGDYARMAAKRAKTGQVLYRNPTDKRRVLAAARKSR